MAQYRQSGGGGGGGYYSYSNGVVASSAIPSPSDHVVPIRSGASQHKQQQQQQHHQLRHHHHRRLKSSGRKISIGSLILIFCSFAFFASLIAFLFLSSSPGYREVSNSHQVHEDDLENDTDFLINVTRTPRSKVLKFGHGSVMHGRDSRYWDRDDRRRDGDYSEEELERVQDGSADNAGLVLKSKVDSDKWSSDVDSRKMARLKGSGLYNEAGRNELKMYEAEYEASLKNAGISRHGNGNARARTDDDDMEIHNDLVDADDEYGDGIHTQDSGTEEDDDSEHDEGENMDTTNSSGRYGGESSDALDGRHRKFVEEDDRASSADLSEEESLSKTQHVKGTGNSRHASFAGGQSSGHSASERRSSSRRKSKRRKFSGSCEMKILNSSAMLVEPLESRKFARFSLQYTEIEEKPEEKEKWEARFSGHQSLRERDESFIARDQKINCGFVRGPKGSSSTGFDLAEDDAKYISACHIAVVSCIFGNSDRLRMPIGKMVSRLSRKNVCFVMFVDEVTLQTLYAEGHMPDRMGFIGLWKIVVVKNLPFTDMRRVGKIPKLLPHRLFSSARYSIWLDSKLRLQLDPLLLLEYFLWRKGYEYAISNHYDRHCVWEEVAQNKKLNKYNHSVIDEQFAFYQADGLKRFNASDPNKLLPSNVPEGSFIVRAHTPMSNLFSCLWYNEVDRFTPRDQLSFAYTYYKLRRMNPEKPFYLNMFKDCERRKIAKLFRHRSDERRSTQRE